MNGQDHGEIYGRIGTIEREQARAGEQLRSHEDAITANTRALLKLRDGASDHDTRLTVTENQMKEIRIVGRLLLGLLLTAVVLQVLAMAGIVGSG